MECSLVLQKCNLQGVPKNLCRNKKSEILFFYPKFDFFKTWFLKEKDRSKDYELGEKMKSEKAINYIRKSRKLRNTKKELLNEGRKASYNNFSSEPHFPHCLVRASSESTFFDYDVF